MSNKNIDIELNQDYFTFGEKKTIENIRQSNVISIITKQYIYRNTCLKKTPYFGNKIRCNFGKQNE